MKMVWKMGQMPLIVVESSSFEGVRRIAGKVAGDIRRVCGSLPEVVTEQELPEKNGKQIVLCATLDRSPLLEELAAMGLVDTDVLKKDGGRKKWEVYQIRLLSLEGISLSEAASFLKGVEKILLICGSDKRGTIYGMFSVSEYIGVSPLCDFGDVEPVLREEIVIREGIEILSGEPSVKYRGFFINDEWPCFGNWVMTHFGGFNADAYDCVFELLLRLKGNYLWPAMWSASFPLDGPGSANEELADLYGVVMGYSHHEPCLRASEEWDKVRGEGTRYGNEWNFYTNREGLLHYWEDALKRSGKYENIITIGMRGERDTSMLGPEATVAENVALLKDIITRQRELIRKYVKRESPEVPLLLALYKEVEPYFYGDENTPGLKDWEGLDGVTCMLCEDNYGYVRTLPTEEIRGHKGGFGMYYHLDYHGAPVSYEWLDCTPFSRIWEQMSMVYEYGIRDVWIVNVGDLKFHEVSLAYFLSLAYDYEKWGYGNPDSPREYTRQWIEKTFRGVSPECQAGIGEVLTGYLRVNGLRRPESLHDGVYHPCHYGETDRMLGEAERLEKLSAHIMEELQEHAPCDCDAYYSMIHFPAMWSMNLLKMHLYTGKNHHYAGQGRIVANEYGRLVKECIRRDREFAESWRAFREGKWSGMELEEHVGFTRWNDDDNRLPVTLEVEPVLKPRMSVSRKDEERIATKAFGAPMEIKVPDFQFAGCSEVILEIANGGLGCLHYEIVVEEVLGDGSVSPGDSKTAMGEALPEWLSVSSMSGEVETIQEIVIRCDRRKLPEGLQKVRLSVKDGEAKVIVEILGRAVKGADSPWSEGAFRGQGVADKLWSEGAFGGQNVALAKLPEGTFFEQNGRIVMDAQHYCGRTDTEKGGFRRLSDYGKFGSGMKVFPSTAAFGEEERKPGLTYRFFLEAAGEYRIELYTAPANPVVYGQGVHLLVNCGDGETRRVEILPPDFRSGDFNDARWGDAAIDQERRTSMTVFLKAGLQELTVAALEAGVILERIILYKPGCPVKKSYLGGRETWICGYR